MQIHFSMSFHFLYEFSGDNLDFYLKITEQTQSASAIWNQAKNLLHKSKHFIELELISSGETPNLKCVHAPTGFKCHLNFTSTTGIYNSKIVAHLLDFDNRIYVLAFIIKFWMKSHNLIGLDRMTDYSTLWLLLFYLQ